MPWESFIVVIHAFHHRGKGAKETSQLAERLAVRVLNSADQRTRFTSVVYRTTFSLGFEFPSARCKPGTGKDLRSGKFYSPLFFYVDYSPFRPLPLNESNA